MNPNSEIAVLEQVEAALEHFASALVTHQTNLLTSSATALQAAVRQLASAPLPGSAGAGDDVATRYRLKKIAASLASQREHLLRHSVLAERSLAALMPACHVATYSPGTGAYGSRTYGSAGRQSGEFRSLAA